MIIADTYDDVSKLLADDAKQKLEHKVDNLGYSLEEMNLLTKEQLQEKLNSINDLISDEKMIEKVGMVEYRRGKDFDFKSDERPNLVGISHTIKKNLIDRKKIILDLIKTKSRDEKIESLEDLINNVGDLELRKKIENELEEFNVQTTKFEEQEKELSKEEQQHESSKKLLEISKTKLELLEKKSQIWLTILAKESIASIIGAFLLIVIAICLLVSMFLGIQTTEIIESAFLLILGYFFGHAVARKK